MLKRKEAKKLQPRFFGPYKVLRRKGKEAYELELPHSSKQHDFFHVSCLKKALGQHISLSSELPPLDEEGKLILVPERIIETRERKLRSRIIKEHLVKWKDLPEEDATRERPEILTYPALHCLRTSNFERGRL